MNAILLATAALAAATVRTTYLETFDHYADLTKSFAAGTGLEEFQSGDMKFLVFRPKTDGELARTGWFPVADAPVGEEWTLSFWHLLRGDSKTEGYEFLLYFGDPAKPDVEALQVGNVPRYHAERYFPMKRRGKKLLGWNLRGRAGTSVSVGAVKIEDGVAREFGDQDLIGFIRSRPPVVDERIPEDWSVRLPSTSKVVYNYAETPNSELAFKLKPSTNGLGQLCFRFADGSVQQLNFLKNIRNAWPAPKGIIEESLEIMLPDLKHRMQLHTHPNASRYERAQQEELQANFDRYPSFWQKVWNLSVRRAGYRPGYDVYLDGNVLCGFTNEHLVACWSQAVKGAEVAVKETTRVNNDTVYKLDFTPWPDGFALSRVRFNFGGNCVGLRSYSGRSPFDAMPSSCHFTVPNRPYTVVRAICSVDTNAPADYVPEVIARFAKYRGLGYEGPSAQHLDRKALLPRKGEKPVKQEGVSIRELADGRYQVDFAMDVGRMQDVIFGVDGYDGVKLPFPALDVEFTACLWEGDTFYVSRAMVPDRFRHSSVVVHSAEVIMPMQEMHAVPRDEFSTYSVKETPGATIHVVNTRGPLPVKVTVKDESGKVVETQDVPFPAGKSEKEISFKQKEVGLYTVEYRGYNITHEARFAIVQDDDERESDWDSPYYAWTWFGANRTTPGIERNLSLLKKYGVRRCDINNRWMGIRGERPGEEYPLYRKYRIHQNQFGYLGELMVRPKPGESDEAAIDRMVPFYKDLSAKFAHTKRALIFHESGGGTYPREMIGGKTVIGEAERISESNRLHQAKLQARAWRKADPSVKLIWGNTVGSIEILGSVYRDPETKDLVDFTGEEGVGVSAPPESETAINPWMQKTLARRMGRGEVPVDCPFEWKARMRRCLGWDEYKQACYTIRDNLIALALGYSMVPVSVGVEVGSSYFESIWGCGTHSRWPEAYPFLAAPATSTLTYVFDDPKFVKLHDTGSLTVYAPQFSVKKGRRYAAAVWCAKGEAPVRIDLGGNASYRLVKMTGREFPDQTKTELVATEEPFYLVTEKPLAAVRTAGKRRFPADAARAKDARVSVPLASAAEVELVNRLDERLYDNTDYVASYTAEGFVNQAFFRRDGKFEVKSVKDEEKGDAIELTDLTGETLAPMRNCCFLRFPKAEPVEGDTLGLWVKGNSSWSSFVFEVTDAEGEVWISEGPGGYGTKLTDWSCAAAIDFDDWHFVRYPLTEKSDVPVLAPGSGAFHWTKDGEKGNGKIDFPVRVTGLGYLASPWAIDLLEMQKVSPSIRVKGIGAVDSAGVK